MELNTVLVSEPVHTTYPETNEKSASQSPQVQ